MIKLILLSLLTLPPQAPPLDVPPQAPPVETVAAEPAFTVTSYGMPGCDPCEEIAKHKDEFPGYAITCDKDYHNHPQWVRDKGATKGYPITVGVDLDGTHVIFYGWGDKDEYGMKLDALKERCTKAAPVRRTQGYVSIPPARNAWTGPVSSKSEAIEHLLNHPNHRGKFQRSYLESLSLADLRRLHDHDHEGTSAAYQHRCPCGDNCQCPPGTCPHGCPATLPQMRHHTAPRVTYRTPVYSQPRYSVPIQRAYYSQPQRTYSAPVYSAPRSYCPTCPR